MYLTLILVLWIGKVLAIPPCPGFETDNLKEDINSLKYLTKSLNAQLEKWNNLFLTSLEPRISLLAVSLASIDSNVNNLQERAHVWDTFQLHVSAWNDQLASLDRKIDIVSKGQEKILALESKVNIINELDYKIDNIRTKIDHTEELLFDLKEKIHSKHNQENHQNLFAEFAARGILSTVKIVEKKIDKLLQSQQSLIISKQGENKPKLMIKCNTRVNSSEENEEELNVEEYVDGSGEIPFEIKTDNDINVSKKKINNINLQDLYDNMIKIEDISQVILNKENDILKKMDSFQINSTLFATTLNKVEERNTNLNENFNRIMHSYFSEQKAHFESLLVKYLTKNKHFDDQQISSVSSARKEKTSLFFEPTKKGCEDLDKQKKSGVYVFGIDTDVNSKNRSYNKKYCLVREDGSWTILQKRDNFPSPQNFNLSWFDYKYGFGNLTKDFWFGNDFISKFSIENDLLLRIELEDFDGYTAWAEYLLFKVFSEHDNYRLIVGIYQGNASDSFSSHNNTFFSTFDSTHDQAPECCPCSVSYGGGWWFNSCFETNLNGIYHKDPYNNGYFGGVIWETWRGDYSLKKTVIMAKPITQFTSKRGGTWPYNEDP